MSSGVQSGRKLRPRATDTIAVTPIAITDRTAHAVLGLDPRPFRDAVIALGVRHRIVGRRMIVLVADFVSALERSGGDAAPARDAEVSVDSLLARMGRRRAS